MILRCLLGLAGAVLGLVGVVDLLDDDWGDLLHTAVWLGAGVVAHDVVLSAIATAVGALLVARLPSYARAPVVVGLVVLGSVTLAVLPTLLGVGAEPDNPSLLDRPYGRGWIVFASLVSLAVVGGSLRLRRTTPDGPEQ